MRVLGRYLLLQLPGWVLAALVVYALCSWFRIPVWVAASCLLLYIGKDFLLFPVLRRAYEPDTRTGAERLVGLTGVVQDEISPEGYVQVRGEYWRARSIDDQSPLKEGSTVRVVSARGLTLTVEPVEERPSQAPR